MKLEEGGVMFLYIKVEGSPKTKLRPALILKKSPKFDDSLICMITTQLRHYVNGIDDIIRTTDSDFKESGLRKDSLFRVSNIFMINKNRFYGFAGKISGRRLNRIKQNLVDWILETPPDDSHA